MPKITVLLADDHTVLRQGLRALLRAEPDIEIVGEAETGREAVELAKKLRPNVVLMDVAMPGLNGLGACAQITKAVPSSRVVVLSSYADDEFVRQATEAGACGYLTKQAAVTDLARAIREAKEGNAFFSPSIARRLATHYRESVVRGVNKPTHPLTLREVEVLQSIAEGKANKQIAADLQISIKTVERHRQRLMNKLDIHDVAGLTRYAVSKGLVETSAFAAKTLNFGQETGDVGGTGDE